MSDQDNGQVSTLKRPTTDDPDGWKTYWKAQGRPWRTEPEVDAQRQKYLAERRAIVPDIEKGTYPFKDIKLSRADVEWLLATHENGRGPVAWNDERQSERKGLDLRGADLRLADLHSLPLVFTRYGLNRSEYMEATQEQRHMAEVHLEGTNLSSAHLEGADLMMARLEGANLLGIHLEEANLFRAHLEGVYLKGAYLGGACLVRAVLDAASNFSGDVKLEDEKLGYVLLADIHWGDANLSRVKWSQVKALGDEYKAKQKSIDGKERDKNVRLIDYGNAIRANRQLAVVLRDQGINEEADHFAYRAQKLQRVVLRRQKKFGQYLFFLFLDMVTGYGYRPGRSVVWYLVTIFGFALAYFAVGHLPFFPDAFVFSLTSFHGRGFFPGLGNENSLHNPLVILAAFEAVVGLLIEISFIATFTQRFFGR